MQNLYYVLILFFLFVSCKNEPSQVKEVELSAAQKIANAHGFEIWNKVDEVRFTFKGKRTWLWKPRTDAVTLIKDTVSINYNRKAIDTSLIRIDRSFINDKFWLFIPFQLVWDKGTNISNPIKEKAPISGKTKNKITIVYSGNGGYTPGDAYDIYYNDAYFIEEWVFRKGNRQKPSIVNTFENYQDFSGIKIALHHKNAKGKPIVSFTNVQVNILNSD